MKRKSFRYALRLSQVCCAVLVVLWVASYWSGFGFKWVRPFTDTHGFSCDVEWFVGCGNGRIYFERYITPFALPSERLGFGYVPYGWNADQQLFAIDDSPERWEILFPVAVPVGMTLILPCLSLHMRYLKLRKLRPRSCRTCSYDLTGNVSGVCPECGTAVAEGLPSRG
jgi:hypothetical protein